MATGATRIDSGFTMRTDIKQIDNFINKNHKLSELIMQIQSQITRLETEVIKRHLKSRRRKVRREVRKTRVRATRTKTSI